MIAAATAVVTANAYYIHPIIARVGEHYNVSDAMIGMVPAMNQFALALGILLLLPLGDWVSNRRLVIVFSIGQLVSIIAMALAENYIAFVLGSTVLGFFTITPYLVPAYVSKRVQPDQLGHATAILTTGVIVGILVARAGAGIVAEMFGWRTVYVIGSLFMLGATLMFPLILEQGERGKTDQRYLGLLGSLPKLIQAHKHVLLSGTIQALGFGGFLCIWMGIGLHLTSPEMGYGVDVVGYLALLALVNMITTPRLGRWADKIGPRRARFYMSLFRTAAVFLFFFSGHNVWLLAIPIIFSNIAGPVVDVSSRMTFLSEEPGVRTRLMTVYIIMMFVGGGIASWAGTAAYDWAGWTGNVALAFGFTLLLTTLAAISYFRKI